MWENFLLGITEDQEMVDFMQRLFGYCITGLTTDHIFPVLWGEHGFNGKGTLLDPRECSGKGSGYADAG